MNYLFTIPIYSRRGAAILALLFAGITAPQLQAQSTERAVVSTSGGHSTSGTAVVSWTFGELATELLTAPGVHLTQGYQQPVIKITPVFVAERVRELVSVYPNPTAEHVYVQLPKEGVRYRLELRDLVGRLLYESTAAAGERHRIDMTEPANGSYVLSLLSESGAHLGSYHIRKLK